MSRPLHRLALITGLLVWAGCPRPHVDVDEVAGKPGQFCVSADDCTDSLSCLENSCCANDNCPSGGSSLMEKDGTASSNNVGRHPSMDRFSRRKCIALCCEGADPARIERALSAWVERIPAHGLAPQVNAP